MPRFFRQNSYFILVVSSLFFFGCHGHPGEGFSGADSTTTAHAPNPQTQAVLAELAALGSKPIESLSPSEARKQPTFQDAVKILAAKLGRSPVESVASVENRAITTSGLSIQVRIYKPQTSRSSLPLIVYYHGGGFVLATIDTYDASARALANASSSIVVSVEYSKSPENKFPAAVNEAYAAYIWATQNASSFGGDPSRVAVCGESAGGNLAAVVSILARDRGAQLPSYQTLIYPLTTTDLTTPSAVVYADAKPLGIKQLNYFFDAYLPSASEATNPLVSPINAELHNLPPATVITAEIDPLKSEGLQYAKKMERSGVKVHYVSFDGVTHEFFGAASVIDEAGEAQSIVGGDMQLRFNELAPSGN